MATSISLDWHPNHKEILLSCGLDQTIKAWNLTTDKKVINICTASPIAKAKWVPGREYLISSIHKQNNSSLMNVWHGMKPNYQQFTIDFTKQQIQDFEWIDSNTVIMAVEKSVAIFNL
jgi:WD40 repeat protein